MKRLLSHASGRQTIRNRLPATKSNIGLGLLEAGDAGAGLPLAALLEEGDALEALEDIPLGAAGADGTKTAML